MTQTTITKNQFPFNRFNFLHGRSKLSTTVNILNFYYQLHLNIYISVCMCMCVGGGGGRIFVKAIGQCLLMVTLGSYYHSNNWLKLT